MKNLKLSILLCFIAFFALSQSRQGIESDNEKSRLALFSKIANHVQQQLSQVFKKSQISTRKPIQEINSPKIVQYTSVRSIPQYKKAPIKDKPFNPSYTDIPRVYEYKQSKTFIPPPPLITSNTNSLSSNSNLLSSNQNYVNGVNNRILGKRNVLTGNKNDLQGFDNCATGNLNTVQGNSNNVRAEKAIVVGNSNNVVETGIDISQLF